MVLEGTGFALLLTEAPPCTGAHRGGTAASLPAPSPAPCPSASGGTILLLHLHLFSGGGSHLVPPSQELVSGSSPLSHVSCHPQQHQDLVLWHLQVLTHLARS